MKTLSELANLYATDKRAVDHNYVKFYEKYFEPLRDLPTSHPDKSYNNDPSLCSGQIFKRYENETLTLDMLSNTLNSLL